MSLDSRDIDSFIKKIDTNFDTISKMKKELTSKYKDYLDTNPFKDLFMDFANYLLKRKN